MFEAENKEHEQEQVRAVVANQMLYKRLFAGEDGQAVLADLEKRCFVNSTTFDDVVTRMAFNEGRRSLYVHIKNLVEKDIQSILEGLIG